MVKGIKDIESGNKDEELNEEIMINAIEKLALNLRYAKFENTERETIIKLKQFVDSFHKKKCGGLQ